MRSDRLVIASVLFLSGGLALLFGFTTGTTALNVGYPFAATRLHIDITTTGIPALLGVPLIAAGSLLLVFAFFAAIGSQLGRRRPVSTFDNSIRRRAPFGEFED